MVINYIFPAHLLLPRPCGVPPLTHLTTSSSQLTYDTPGDSRVMGPLGRTLRWGLGGERDRVKRKRERGEYKGFYEGRTGAERERIRWKGNCPVVKLSLCTMIWGPKLLSSEGLLWSLRARQWQLKDIQAFVYWRVTVKPKGKAAATKGCPSLCKLKGYCGA